MSDSNKLETFQTQFNNFYYAVTNLQSSIKDICSIHLQSDPQKSSKIYSSAKSFIDSEVAKTAALLTDVTTFQSKVEKLNQSFQSKMLNNMKTYVENIRKDNEQLNKALTTTLNSYYQSLADLSNNLTKNMNESLSGSEARFVEMNEMLNSASTEIKNANEQFNSLTSLKDSSLLMPEAPKYFLLLSYYSLEWAPWMDGIN